MSFLGPRAGNPTLDYDNGAAIVDTPIVGVALPASGGPVAGGTSTNPLRVDPTGTTTQPVSGTVTITPSGTQTVAISQTGTNNDVDVNSIAAGDNNIGNVDIVTLPNVTLAAGTNTNEVVGDAASGTAKSGNPVQIGAVFNTTQPTVTTGQVVEAQATSRGAAIVATGIDTFNVTVNAALPAGTANIGDVDIVTMPSVVIGSGTVTTVSTVTSLTQMNGAAISMNTGVRDAGTQRVTVATNDVLPASQSGTWTVQPGNTANTTAWLVNATGSGADDGVTLDNPVMTGGRAVNFDGTDPGNVSAENDAARLNTDMNRRLLVNPVHPFMWSYHENSSSALTDASVQAAPGLNYSLFVTDIVVSTGAATAFNIFFEEGTTTTVLGPYYLEAVAGRGLAIHFNTPKKITANTALTVTTSAAIAHSIDVCGFTARVT